MTIIKDTFKNLLEEKTDQAVARIEKTPTQKLIVSVLVLFSVGVIVLGFFQIKTFLEKPFFSQKLVEDKAKIRGPIEFYQYLLEQNKNQEDLVTLQKRDSDLDGLTDYQETYIYHTNLYSADSDSDGVGDQEEAAKGTDPNCAANDSSCVQQNAAAPTGNTQGGQTTNAPSLQDALGQAAMLGASITADSANTPRDSNSAMPTISSSTLQNLTPEQKEEVKQYFQNLAPADLRALLIDQGFPQDQVNNLSDEDLKQTLDQLLSGL